MKNIISEQVKKVEEATSDMNNPERPPAGAQHSAQAGRGPKRRPINNYDHLIGAIDQGTSSTRFLVFENQTGRLVASSQIEIKRITPREGWVEMCPTTIMSSVYATIANVHEQLVAKQANCANSKNKRQQQQQQQQQQRRQSSTSLLKCIGICNQRESTVVWDSITGQPLYNVIVWMDNRTKDLVDNMIDSIPGRDFNWLKDKTGLPMSTYFSAFKLKWLIENVAGVREALYEKRLMFGTVDTWILWNLTGRHLTDVTNASRTFLMDIETLQWDKSLCKQLKISMDILPKILASADDFGSLRAGPFKGTPITGVIGDQSAALLGQNCLQLGQTKATLGTGCFIMQNIGPGPLNGALSGVHRAAKRGLITTVGYKLGDRPACYALEGSIKIAGAALTWLRDNLQLIENYEQCDQLINKTSNSAGVFFVPALGGLYSPYWDPNAAGLFIGLSQFSRREHLVRATFDAIAFQTNDILSLMRGVVNGLMIDGGLCKSDNLCQILADITGYDIVRPSMCESSALGAAMVAGYGAHIWNLESMMANSNTPYEYSSLSNQNHHYPHESLNYEDKFSSIIQSKGSLKSSAGRPTKGKPSSERQFRPSQQQQQQVEAANNSNNNDRNIRKGQINCQFDAGGGGGINDDAGGGDHLCSQLFADTDDFEDVPGGQPTGDASSDTSAFDGTNTQSSAADLSQSQQHQHHQQPPPGEPLMESSFESEIVSIITDNQHQASSVLTAQDSNQLISRFYAPPNSDYSSGDNLELATTNSAASCQLTEPGSAASGGGGAGSGHTDRASRIESPVFSSSATQAATTTTTGLGSLSNGRDSAATCTDLIISSDHQTVVESVSMEHQQSSLVHSRSAFEPFQVSNDDADDDDDQKSDDVGDVHAFGGRDSYGEDGYDSSTASNFESEDDEHEYEYDDDDDDDEDEQASLNEDNQLDDQEQDQTLTSILDKSKNKPRTRNQHHNAISQPQRARLLSTTTKPVDVFQSYISLEHRTDLVGTWRLAVGRSMEWTKVHHEEIRRIDYQRLSSLPISMYLFFSIGLVALSSILSPVSLPGT